MPESFQFFFNTIDLNIGKFSIPFAYWQAGIIVFLLFLLMLMTAHIRRHYIDWSFKGGLVGIFFGFMLALILEGFLLLGGKTVLTGVLGWKNPPKPIAQVLDKGKSQLIQVLGESVEVPSSVVSEKGEVQNVILNIQALNPGDLKSVKNILCKP